MHRLLLHCALSVGLHAPFFAFFLFSLSWFLSFHARTRCLGARLGFPPCPVPVLRHGSWSIHLPTCSAMKEPSGGETHQEQTEEPKRGAFHSPFSSLRIGYFAFPYPPFLIVWTGLDRRVPSDSISHPLGRVRALLLRPPFPPRTWPRSPSCVLQPHPRGTWHAPPPRGAGRCDVRRVGGAKRSMTRL